MESSSDRFPSSITFNYSRLTGAFGVVYPGIYRGFEPVAVKVIKYEGKLSLHDLKIFWKEVHSPSLTLSIYLSIYLSISFIFFSFLLISLLLVIIIFRCIRVLLWAAAVFYCACFCRWMCPSETDTTSWWPASVPAWIWVAHGPCTPWLCLSVTARWPTQCTKQVVTDMNSFATIVFSLCSCARGHREQPRLAPPGAVFSLEIYAECAVTWCVCSHIIKRSLKLSFPTLLSLQYTFLFFEMLLIYGRLPALCASCTPVIWYIET